MIRLGLCCIFKKAPIRFRTTTASRCAKLRQAGEDPLRHLSSLIIANTVALEEAITYCHSRHIGDFRINSRFFPLATHPHFSYRLEDLPDAPLILRNLRRCRRLAMLWDIRLTLHPDQFVVLNSPDEDIVRKSIEELEYHAILCKLVGADVINIHGGGGYGDKQAALIRLGTTIKKLPMAVRRHLTLENDDRVFTPEDLLPICKRLRIPFVYDVHHHRCLPDGLSVGEATQQALATWNREPLFHLSSPIAGWKGAHTRHHGDFIAIRDFPAEWKNIDPLTIEVEAKAKEIAVERLLKQLA